MYRTSMIMLLLCTLTSALLLTGCPCQPDLAVSATSHHFGIDPNSNPNDRQYETEWTFEVWNSGGKDTTLVFAVTASKPWIEVAADGDRSTGAADKVTVTVRINRDYAAAKNMDFAAGEVLVSASVASKSIAITTAPDYFTQVLDGTGNDLEGWALTWKENGGPSFYGQTKTAITDFPTDPTGGLLLSFDDFGDPIQAGLFGGEQVSFYGVNYDTLYIASEGWVSFGEPGGGDTIGDHFATTQLSGLLVDATQPGSMVSYLQDDAKLAITYEDVPTAGTTDSLNDFQIELFFDGSIQMSFLNVDPAMTGVLGLSNGVGQNQAPPERLYPQRPYRRQHRAAQGGAGLAHARSLAARLHGYDAIV